MSVSPSVPRCAAPRSPHELDPQRSGSGTARAHHRSSPRAHSRRRPSLLGARWRGSPARRCLGGTVAQIAQIGFRAAPGARAAIKAEGVGEDRWLPVDIGVEVAEPVAAAFSDCATTAPPGRPLKPLSPRRAATESSPPVSARAGWGLRESRIAGAGRRSSGARHRIRRPVRIPAGQRLCCPAGQLLEMGQPWAIEAVSGGGGIRTHEGPSSPCRFSRPVRSTAPQPRRACPNIAAPMRGSVALGGRAVRIESVDQHVDVPDAFESGSLQDRQ